MSDERLAAELQRIRTALSDLEAVVSRQRAEIGDLRLQLDVLGTLDPVSGLPNLAGIVDLVDAAGRRLDRDGEPFAVMALEMAGLRDGEVRNAGAVLTAALRRVDRPGWAGGSSFLVVLPGVNEAGARTVLGRLLGAVSGMLDGLYPMQVALVLCAQPPAPAAFRIVDRARRLAGDADPGTSVVEDYAGPLDW